MSVGLVTTEEWATSRAQDIGELLKQYGRGLVFRCQGEELRVGFTVVDVKRPILSVSRVDGQRHRNIHPSWQAVSATI